LIMRECPYETGLETQSQDREIQTTGKRENESKEPPSRNRNFKNPNYPKGIEQLPEIVISGDRCSAIYTHTPAICFNKPSL